jgi:hypothetical protein
MKGKGVGISKQRLTEEDKKINLQRAEETKEYFDTIFNFPSSKRRNKFFEKFLFDKYRDIINKHNLSYDFEEYDENPTDPESKKKINPLVILLSEIFNVDPSVKIKITGDIDESLNKDGGWIYVQRVGFPEGFKSSNEATEKFNQLQKRNLLGPMGTKKKTDEEDKAGPSKPKTEEKPIRRMTLKPFNPPKYEIEETKGSEFIDDESMLDLMGAEEREAYIKSKEGKGKKRRGRPKKSSEKYKL